MPYSSVSEVPANVPHDKKKQWMEVFNSAYERTKGDTKEKERVAFAEANSVAGPNSKIAKAGTALTQYEAFSNSIDQCQVCKYFEANRCSNALVAKDPEVPLSDDGKKLVNPNGWCKEYESKVTQETQTNADAGEKIKGMKNLGGEKKKFIFVPFIKVDAQKREVWGVVTAEVPDKEDEVCDYAGTKPHYQALIDEMSKATDGGNYCPLREMHQPSAVGKGIGYELRDLDKEIFFGYKVVDDTAWRKVEEKVYTGFSHGGVKVGEDIPDPVFKGCMRYVAKPSEVSLVDNPCLGVAHFQYVSKTGDVELRKNRSSVDQSATETQKSIANLNAQLAELRKRLDAGVKKTSIKVSTEKTKRVAGEDLPSTAFLIVGDVTKTDTWHLPVKFSTDDKTKRHIKSALARVNQVKGVSDQAREAAKKRLHALAAQHNIDVAKEKAKFAAITVKLRKLARTQVSRYARAHGDPGHALTFLDGELGKLAKGMCEVSNLSWMVQDLACLCHSVCCEQEWEGDETSPLPGMLETEVGHLLDTLVAMVAEESDELRDQVADRVAG